MEKRWIWPFELEDKIGEGAMGVVYRARFVKNDRRVALKLLPHELAANPTQVMRFQREMEVLKELRHPNIVHCFGGTCEGKQQFYAMELIQGGTLASLINEQGRIPWRQVIEYGLQICAALAYSHAKGIIHRDLKPGNLLVTTTNQLKLSDYGLAMVAADVKLTAAGKTMGSLHYMPPEQIRGAPPATHRVDLYALGCVLFEMLAGRTVFQATTQAELLQKHLVEPPPKVSQFVYDCPRQLDELISELLFKDPEHRPADAASVAIRLKSILRSVVVRNPADERQAAARHRVDQLPGDRRRIEWRRLVMPVLLCALIAVLWFRTPASGPSTAAVQSVRPLAEGLKDANPAVREFAAAALAKHGPTARGALPPLVEALADPVPEVRMQVAHALGKIDSRDPAVWAKLRLMEKNDPVSEVRHAATQALSVVNATPATAGQHRTDLIPLVILSVVVLAWGIVQLIPLRSKQLRPSTVQDERLLVSS